MKNQVSVGDAVDIASAPYTLTSGQGCLVGSLFGIAAYGASSANPATLWTKGVFSMAKTSAQAWTVGALIYWDDTNKVATTVSTSNKLIGVATAAAANPSSVGSVRLNGAFIS
jgi:predicted RecA/RadA family phage recombinase